MSEASFCPNCQSPAAGNYCPVCGQKQAGRLALRYLGSEFLARFFSAERGVWKTFVALTLRPGRMARDYLDGRRQRYVSPLLWYALCAAAQLVGIWILRERVSTVITDGLPPQYFAYLESQGVVQPKAWAAGRYHALIQNAYSWLGMLTFVLPMAVVMRLVARAMLNMAEALVVSLLSIGHVMLITAITGQVLIRVDIWLHGVVSYCLYFVYALLTVGNCCGWNVRSVAAGILGIVIGGCCFFGTLIWLTGLALTTGF
jgi:hypothetical protein